MNATITLGDRKKFKTDLFPSESIFIDIKKEDGTEFDATTTASWILRDESRKTVSEGDILKSADLTIFELRFYQSDNISPTKNYELLARLQDSASHYNDVVLSVDISAQ